MASVVYMIQLSVHVCIHLSFNFLTGKVYGMAQQTMILVLVKTVNLGLAILLYIKEEDLSLAIHTVLTFCNLKESHVTIIWQYFVFTSPKTRFNFNIIDLQLFNLNGAVSLNNNFIIVTLPYQLSTYRYYSVWITIQYV